MRHLTQLLIGLAVLCLFTLSCNSDDANSKKAVKSLVDDVITKAPSAETAGNFVNFLKTLKQAQGLDSVKQCEAARKIYCELFRAVKENDGGGQLCTIIQDELYGGSFPAGGMTACKIMADDKIAQLQGSKAQLQKICMELRANKCK